MNIILLSGGSGKRLWPVSNDIRSKQFVKIFKNNNNEYESMVQRIYNQIDNVDKDSVITIATSELQVPYIKSQLGEKVGISIEPCRKDTFPAIALATAYLKDVQKVSEDEVVVVCPVDPYVDESYFKALKKLSETAAKGESNLVLMGIKPTYPSEKFGYIIPNDDKDISEVLTFKEKPNIETAKEYIKQNALWNGGVFAFKIKYLLNKAHELIDFIDYEDLFNKYETLNKISFDYAVVEKENKIQVVRFSGKWEDLGTWNSLTKALDEKIIGNGLLSEDCQNTSIVNELDIPVLGVGLKNIVISASPDGILVSDKEKADNIKNYVEKFNNEPMMVETSWGSINVIEEDNNNKSEIINIKAGNVFRYVDDEHLFDKFIIVSGSGTAIFKEVERKLNVGDVLEMENETFINAIQDIKLVRVKVKVKK